jgi:plastocyanin
MHPPSLDTAPARCATILLLAAIATGCAVPCAGPAPDARPLRGRVLSAATGEPLRAGAPLVICVRSPETAAGCERDDAVLRQDGTQLAPPFLAVAPDQEVRFQNRDRICHSWFSTSEPNSFQTEQLHPGDDASVRFARPGFVHVYCTLHRGRQATILVTPVQRFALVDPAGGFEIPGLPPGPHRLEAWSERYPRQQWQITIPSHGARFVELRLADHPAARSPE